MKPVVICSNMLNEIDQIEEWYENMSGLGDGKIIVVDQFSTDGTYEFCVSKPDIMVVQSNIILEEGYGEARNYLRQLSKEFFPDAHWCCFFDADERINKRDYHQFRWIKDYLLIQYDVIAFPRIDWLDKEKTKAAKDYLVYPDWQARMTRLTSPIKYVRKLHEQVTGHKAIYANYINPPINHFHRSAPQGKRDLIGKVCAKLHSEDTEYGASYPKHHKEDMYFDKYQKEGINE